MTTETNVCPDAAPSFFSDEQAGRLILHNIQDSFVLVNPQLSVVYCNRAAREGVRRFFGVEIFPGMNLLDLAQESRKELLKEIFASVLKGERHTTETQFTQKDGSVIHYEHTYCPAYTAEEEITGIIVSSKDITACKKAQQIIQQSEERLQFALEAASQGAWDWNLETNEVVYSASYKKLYGFDDSDLKNHVSEWMTRIHPDDQEKMKTSVTEHLSAGNYEYDSQYRIRAKDGSYRWVLAKGRLVYFDETGKPLRMIGTHTDITEAVEREEALKLMNERFDCMMKATHGLLWEWDIINNEVFRSKESLMSVLGVADDTHFNTFDFWFQRLHPEDQPAVLATLNDILKGSHHQTFEFMYRFRRDDNSYAHIHDRCILLKDEKDKPVRLIGSAQDISERNRLEKELVRNELEYQKLIHQATVDSQERERAEIGKELHDNVNQVLTTTKLYLDLACTETALKDDLIKKSLLNINNVIQEIRLLSRSLMDPSIGDLGLLESITDLIENIHLTQKLAIRLHADNEIENLLDANQKLTLFRIIQESLNNVLRHAKASSASISIVVNSGQLTLSIQDDGIGFDSGKSKKGAGLKNIQNRIYLINGTLQLQSMPGKGCTLQLQFPIENK